MDSNRCTKTIDVGSDDEKEAAKTARIERSYRALDLTAIPSSLFDEGRRSTLVVLDLSRNSIGIIPSQIGTLSCLEHLNVSRNRLRDLPKELGCMKRLRTLDAKSNKLNQRTLPLDRLATLPALRTLDLRFNKKCNNVSIFRAAIPHLVLGTCEEVVEERSTPALHVWITSKTCAATRDAETTHACDRDATLLRSQLEPWSTPTLRRRLRDVFGVETDPDVQSRGTVMDALLACYEKEGPRRKLRHVRSALTCPKPMYDALLKALRAWVDATSGQPRERPFVRATSYMTLRSPLEFGKASSKKAQRAADKVARYRTLWDLSAAAMRSIDPAFADVYTAVAFTHNFVGSPHIDTQNIGPFYGLGLGSYEGGELCVESGPREVTCIDTRGRFARVDGRYPHWVAPYKGTRFSIIFYRTIGSPEKQGRAVLSEVVVSCANSCDRGGGGVGGGDSVAAVVVNT